jgi:hypothetical protein
VERIGGDGWKGTLAEYLLRNREGEARRREGGDMPAARSELKRASRQRRDEGRRKEGHGCLGRVLSMLPQALKQCEIRCCPSSLLLPVRLEEEENEPGGEEGGRQR